MANKKAAKKYILVSKRKNIRNAHFKTLMKTKIKQALTAIETQDKDCVKIVRDALRQIDITASKGIIHKNNAGRKKSILAKKVVDQTTSSTKKVETPKTKETSKTTEKSTTKTKTKTTASKAKTTKKSADKTK